MANRLADLNRSKRDYAFSGKANVGDVPWLYALQAEQAAANQPAGIGQGGGNTMAEGAPNPQSFGGGVGTGGGGASGGADTGLPGPGQTGLGDNFDQFYRDFVAEGGQAGEPGGGGAGSVDFGAGGYVDPTLAELVGYLGPGPVGFVGSLGAAGMRGYNAGILDTELQDAGYPGLSGWQQIGAAVGTNQYGAGDPRDTWGAQGIGGLAEAGYEAAQASGNFGGLNDPALGVSANQRARSDTRGGAQPGSSYGYSAEGASASARHRERERNRGGGAGESGGGGGGGFGCFVGDTHILMADGSRKKIRLIEKGDMVMAFEGRGELEPREVVAKMEYPDRKPIRVYFGEGQGVVVTPEHPFLTETGEYKRAGDLKPRDLLVNAEGFLVPVLEINTDAKKATVYNFEVEGLHTYVAKGLRVHNIKHDGGVISEERAPGYRGDVQETLQEGEGVITADAVELLGPGFIHGVNMMAKMMRGRR